MDKTKVKYSFINSAVLFITIALLVHNYINIVAMFAEMDIYNILSVVAVVCLVHLIKAGRLYIALYGSDIKLLTYVKTYCKVTPVCVILPYKLGEIFRIYCYGIQLKSLFRGGIIVILDRFMDTIALITMILILCIFNGEKITAVVYVLIIFVIIALIIYSVFPEIYTYWKKYILCEKASEYKLSILKSLNLMNDVYREIKNIVKGRGIILYFISLFGWTVEMGSIVLINEIHGRELNRVVLQYLSSAIGSHPTIELKQFILVSVSLMMVVYAAVKLIGMLYRRRNGL